MSLRYHFKPYDFQKVPQSIIIGCSSDPLETRFGPSKRNLYLIHYVISGTGYFNGHAIQKGQGFLITPGMAEHYYPDEKDPWTYLWFASMDPVIEYYFERCEADPETSVFQYQNMGGGRRNYRSPYGKFGRNALFLYTDSGNLLEYIQQLCVYRVEGPRGDRKALL